MDGLLKEIRCKDEAAASVLEQAGLRADSDLQLLTLHNLGLLFPGVENVKLRRKIFYIIHKQKPIDVLIEEFKDFIPHESLRAALTENGVLVDYLKMLKEMKTQMNNDFLDRHISLLEDFRKSQPSQDQDKDEIMDILLKEIRRKDEAAASVLEHAGLRADSDLQLLTVQEAGELFPGVENFKRIRKIFDIIQTQKPIDILIKEFKDFIPHESLRAALTENGVLTNYLKMLKETKIQVNKVQDFLDAHINLLEDFRKSQPSQDQDKGSFSSSDNSQTGEPPQIQQDITASSAMMSPPSPTSTRDHPEERSGSLSSSDNSQTSDPPQIQQDITASSAMMSPPSPTSTPDHPKKRSGSLSSSDNSQTGDPPQIQQDTSTSSAMMSPPSPTSTPDHPEKRSGSFSSSHNSQTGDPPQIQQDCSSRSRSLSMRSIISTHVQPQKRQVTYKMVVSGITFDADKQLLHRVMTSSGDRILKLLSQEDGDVIIVFCPVVSRMGTDVEAAMAQVTGDKPVILVVMHHTYGARSVPSVKTWKDSCKVVLCVHVFYHEKVPGLLPCQENNDAIFKIRTELLKYGVDITESTSGDTQNRFIPKFFSKYIK
ncbi:uncharacterized protein LOC102078051 isoform X29 [Oreochromis niloticus]|uniref:uncharacterized protein LOC102078051 isoform X29 n=1 Tax=Oreochromis niloticus TaxID=8128 RepID=UPI000DF416FB|nr:uncharacterized protein LOC102078051 isoform X29 [Oreochromis niloticus]